MKKILVGSVVTLLVAFGSDALAQKKDLIKGGIRAVTTTPKVSVSRAQQLVPAMRGVYIPAGTTWATLEREIERTAHAAGMEVNARMLAANPVKLHQFEIDAGRRIFGSPAMPYEQGLNVLRENQARFAQARANGEYDAAWEEFLVEKHAKLEFYRQNPDEINMEEFYKEGFDSKQIKSYQQGLDTKIYSDVENLAIDVYNFHVRKLHTEAVPQVRLTYGNLLPEGVYEIPVNGLSILIRNSLVDKGIVKGIPAEEFVVLVDPMGRSHLVQRGELEWAEGGEPVIYEVVHPAAYKVVK